MPLSKFSKIKLTFLFLLSLTILSSCIEEKTVGGEPLPRKFAVITKAKPFSISIFEPSENKTLDEDAFFTANKRTLNSISSIAEFRDTLYIIQNDASKITVTDHNFNFIYEIDFSTENLKPEKIVFPNATTSFISFSNDSVLKVFDLINKKVARTIKLPHLGIPLLALEQFVYVLHPFDSKLSKIDTRDYELKSTIKVGNYPIGIDFNPENNNLFVLCLGKGKLDNSEEPTEAKLQVYSSADLSLLKELNVNIGNIPAKNVIVTGIAVPNRLFGYVSSLNALLRFSAINLTQFQRVIAGSFTNVFYNFKRDEIVAIESKDKQTRVFLINPNENQIVYSFTLGEEIILLFHL